MALWDRYVLALKREVEALRDVHAAASDVDAARKSGARDALDAMLDELEKALGRHKAATEARHGHRT